jgi:glycosyltransferase involved in cell wall biosynthesis
MRDVVPLGVDTDFYSPLPPLERSILRENLSGDPATPIILFVGRMVERKGVHIIRSLMEKHREWHWVLVGRPDDFNPKEWRAPNLSYFQIVSEQRLRELYSCADLLVHPSVGEGVTLIVSESLASGTPVVISQESLYEVEHKDRDLFFAVQPEANDVEENLIRALADRQHLEKLRADSREYALNRLSWKKMTEQYLLILSELVSLK